MLKAEGLSCEVDGHVLLEDISISLDVGESRALLGPSGSGKSTLLSVLLGLMPLRSGVVYHGDQLCAKEGYRCPPEQLPFRGLLQGSSLFDHLDVLGNLNLARPSGIGVGLRPALGDLLEILGISHLLNRHISGLSGGERQRIALARTLMSSDSLVLLDEPFSDVDAYSKERILPELKVWLKDREMSVLLATHDRREACEMAEQWTLLKDGHCIQQGEPQDLYHDPQDLWCAQFTGPFNVLSEQDMALLKLPLSGLNRWEMASETVMGCRPEQLLIRDIHDRGSASSIGGQGLLVSKRFVGRDWDCRVELDSGTPLQVLLHREPLIRCGQRVELYFREVRGGV